MTPRPELFFHNRYLLWAALAVLAIGGGLAAMNVAGAVKTRYVLKEGVAVDGRVGHRKTYKGNGRIFYRLIVNYRMPGDSRAYSVERRVSKKRFDATPLKTVFPLRIDPGDHNRAVFVEDGNPRVAPAATFTLLTLAAGYYLWGWHKYTDLHGIGARPDLDPHVQKYRGFR
jgi:hypothetical protein